MSVGELLGYFFGATCVITALYVAVGRDLLRVSIAFFIELASIGGVMLSLGAEYLALVMVSIGLMGTLLVISFSSIIMGSLKESFKEEERVGGRGGGRRVTRALGMALGLGVGGAIGWALLSAPFLDGGGSPDASRGTDVSVLGHAMLGERVAVFELLAVMVLLVIIGAGFLLRKPNDAN